MAAGIELVTSGMSKIDLDLWTSTTAFSQILTNVLIEIVDLKTKFTLSRIFYDVVINLSQNNNDEQHHGRGESRKHFGVHSLAKVKKRHLEFFCRKIRKKSFFGPDVNLWKNISTESSYISEATDKPAGASIIA